MKRKNYYKYKINRTDQISEKGGGKRKSDSSGTWLVKVEERWHHTWEHRRKSWFMGADEHGMFWACGTFGW